MSDSPLFGDDPIVDPRTMTDRELLIRMDGRLGLIAASNSGLVATQRDHETRLRSVEKKLWLLAGAATVLGTVGGKLAGFLLPN